MPVKAVPQKNADPKVEKLKFPPHSIGAERDVLGSMRRERDSRDKVAGDEGVTVFYVRGCGCN